MLSHFFRRIILPTFLIIGVSANGSNTTSSIAPQCALAVGGRGQDTPLALGEVLRVRVNVVGTRLFTWLSFDLTSAPPADKSCSISISRLSPNDKTIRWTSYWDGNLPTNSVIPSDDGEGPWPSEMFPGGQHSFLVARRPSEPGTPEHLAVWLEERPDRVAKVEIREGCDRLQVTTFVGSVSPVFYSTGNAECGQGMALPIGSKVRVGVTVHGTDQGPTFRMRRPSDPEDGGSSVHVTGMSTNGWSYSAYGPNGEPAGSHNDQPNAGHDRFGQPQLAPRLPEGEHVFVIERRPKEMAVWLERQPGQVATAPVLDDATRLSVHSINLVLYEKIQ